jgi:predicted XRE-type DNA-binding protein
MRSDLMTSIERNMAAWNLSQAEAAKRLHITLPRLNDLMRGKINRFTLDALSKIAIRAGLTIKMSVKKQATKRAA